MKKLEDFKQDHADSRGSISSWVNEVEEAEWGTPHDIKDKFPKASILKGCEVIFNIKGNNYRLKVKVNYQSKIVLVQKIGTHNEYMTW